MNAIITTVLPVLLFFHAHHGVHCSCAPLAAFQCSKYHTGSFKNTPSCVSSSSSQLRYSTAEDGGIISSTWLQQPTIKQQQQQLTNTDVDEFGGVGTIIIDREDDVDCINDDDKVTGNFIIDDDWTNDSKQRRYRRIQSLEQFNKDSQQQKQQQQQQDTVTLVQQSSINERFNDGREDTSSSSQRQLILDTSTSNSIGLPYNDISQLQAIQSNAPAILLPSGPG